VLVGGLLGTAALLAGCTATDDLMSSMQLPASSTAQSTVPNALARAGSPPVGPNKLVVTGQQRAYLDSLAAGGVHPSSDLLALSIGSYICQAQAAGQSPQAVWDYIHPLVLSDVRNARPNAPAPSQSDVDAAARSYIRIATDQLC
jgi:Protein of unknown function (DUF732)